MDNLSSHNILVPNKPKLSHYSALYKELKALIEGYKGGLTALSHKVSLSKPTLWRWANNKNSKAPNAHHVLALLKFLKKEPDLYKLINSCTPEIKKFLKDAFRGDFARGASPQYSPELNDTFEDFHCYLIHRLANTEKKMSRKDIKKAVGIYLLGEMGLTIEDESLSDGFLVELGCIADYKINKLIAEGVLIESSGVITTVIKNPKIKLELTKKHLPKLFNYFKEHKLADGTNMLYSYQECISKKGIDKILRIQYDAFMESYKVMEQEKCEDGEIYLLNVFFESLNL